MDRPHLAHKLRLYLVADPDHAPADLLPIVRAALANGVTAVQLRSKSSTDREHLALARELRVVCRESGALFLVNDRVDIAHASGADGVHLGIDDIPVPDARRLLGPDAVIGYSPETDAQAEQAREHGASYLGVGPVIATTSKADAGDAIGFDGLRRRVDLAGIPVIGIGGITPATYPEVLASGAVGAAVIRAILRADDPGAAARSFALAVERVAD